MNLDIPGRDGGKIAIDLREVVDSDALLGDVVKRELRDLATWAYGVVVDVDLHGDFGVPAH